MIARSELRRIARARLRDAEALFAARRYDGAMHLCGYAAKLALKARICRTLHWDGFPTTTGEFASYQSFRTHNLDVLLNLAGLVQSIPTRFPIEWSVVVRWNPERRYHLVGTTTREAVRQMIEATRTLLRAI